MGDEQYHPSGRFGGDMDRNEVEMDLNKFMAMIEEIGALKDKIRTLEDVKNNNPYQKVIFIAQAQEQHGLDSMQEQADHLRVLKERNNGIVCKENRFN